MWHRAEAHPCPELSHATEYKGVADNAIRPQETRNPVACVAVVSGGGGGGGGGTTPLSVHAVWWIYERAMLAS